MSTAAVVHQQPAPAPRKIPGGEQGGYALVLAAAHRIEPLLPDGVSIDYVAATVYQAVKKDENLRKCDGSSIVDAVCKILQWRLDVGTTAHIVPFGTTATPVADYKGLAHLMIASGFVRAIETRVVREGDAFEYRLGLEPMLDHRPTAKSTAKITHAYCVLVMRGGVRTFHVMDIEEVDAIRLKHSKQWKHGSCPAWYAKKTVLRQMAKLIPSPALAQALRVAQDDETIEFEGLTGGASLQLGGARPDADDTPSAPALAAGEGEPRVYRGRPGKMVETEPYDDAAAQQEYVENGGASR